MTRFLLFILIVFLISCKSSVDTNHQLKVKVELAEPLSENEKIYISGNHSYLGDWAPAVVELNKVDDLNWEAVLLFPSDTLLEYKFTKGDWNLEAVNTEGEVPGNNRVYLKSDTVVIHQIDKWKDQVELSPGKVVGNVQVIKEFDATEIKDRQISIWLPPSYEEEAERRYPVLYVHDGQNVFDKRRAGYNMEWELDENADSLISNGIVEPFIIVAIDNDGPNRSAEYSDSELGSQYRNFVINELKPYIDQNYRTKPDSENTATLGSSMGGLVSFMLAWENPDVFSKAACFSPAFIYNDHNYVQEVKSYTGARKDIELYIDNGGLGLELRLQPGIDQMMDLLDKQGYDYEWRLFKDHEHNELAWARRVYLPLIQFYGNSN